MTDTGIRNLDAAFQTFNMWLIELQDSLHFENRQQAYKALKVTLHAIRDFITVNQSANFSSQIPMIARGLYYEGFVPARLPTEERDREEFLAQIRDNFDQAPGPQIIDPIRIAEGVFELINKHVSPGAVENVRGELPGEIAALWPSPSANGAARPEV